MIWINGGRSVMKATCELAPCYFECFNVCNCSGIVFDVRLNNGKIIFMVCLTVFPKQCHFEKSDAKGKYFQNNLRLFILFIST